MIPFSPWLPDIAAFQTDVATDALNVIPSSSGYRPLPSLVGVTAAPAAWPLTARPQGAISARSLSGNIYNFCGDATKLYQLSSDGLSWNDVSRTVGGAYTTPADNGWSFAQYGDYIIAANGNDATQYFQLGISTNFAALAGSPPVAYFTGTIREFGVLARTSTENNRIRWSAIGNISDWVSSATTLSDYQDFPDGGKIMGFVGGEYGLIFQERAIQRMTFEGPPTAFRFDKISTNFGCRAEGSIAAYDNLAFFLSDNGAYMVRGGAEIVPIGTEKVDAWIEANLDETNLNRVSSAIDPVNKLYLIGFMSYDVLSAATCPDTILIYHWPTGQWSRAEVSHQILFTSATQNSYTIDTMDLVSSTIDGLPYPVDARFWSGSGRLSLSAFDANGKLGFFSGSSMEATVETGDSQLNPGGRALLRGLRPMVEGLTGTPTLTVGYRNSTGTAVQYGSAISANAYGFCNARVNARYHRAKITIPAASQWSFARGIDDVKFSPMGSR